MLYYDTCIFILQIESSPNASFIEKGTLRVKLTGDGTNIGKHLNVVNFAFTILEEGDRAHSMAGNHCIVISILEKPQLHILAQSGSSEIEQMVYNDTRSECLHDLDTPIHTAAGKSVADTIRYFHGDGRAQEFEIGHNR